MNIVDASLDWWYSKTYTQIDSTFMLQFNANDTATGWSVAPATTGFNVTSAVLDPSCQSVTAFNTRVGSTMLQYSCWDTPTPVAAVTSTVEQTAYKPINATTGKGSIPSVVTKPTPAALTLTVGNSTQSVSSGVPVVHFSKYEVVSKGWRHDHNGKKECSVAKTVHRLPEVHSFSYYGQDHVNGPSAAASGVVGDVQPSFLRAFGQARATPGTFRASPTVVVVVEKVVAAAGVLAQQIMQTQSALEKPSATLPSGLSYVQSTPTKTGTIWASIASAHIESTESALEVPTRQPAPGGNGPPSKQVEAPPQTTNRPPNAGMIGHLVSAVGSALRPTDAGEVLSQAELTFGHRDPTASAIAGIIGAVPNANQGDTSASGASNRPNSGGASGAGVAVAGDGSPGANGDVQSNGNIASNAGPGPKDQGGSHVDSGTNEGPPQAPVLTIGDVPFVGHMVGGQTAPAMVLNGQTARAGGPAITVDGTRVSLVSGASAVVIGHSTSHLGAAAPNPGAAANIPLLTLGSRVFTANAATQFNIDGSIVAPGKGVVVHGTSISLAPGATQVIVDGVRKDLAAPEITPAPLLTIGSNAYRPNMGSTYNIGGHILAPGGTITLDGTTLAMPVGGSNVLVNGVVQTIGAGRAGDYNTITALPVLTFDGHAYAPSAGNVYVIAGQTLTPGGTITLNGPHGSQTISLNRAADKLVSIANGATATSKVGVIGAGPGGAPVLTLEGRLYSAVDYDTGSGATYLIDGQTLTPGGSIVITGAHGMETISLVNGGTALVKIQSGTISTSSIPGAYGVQPTEAPVLTIGGETYTAFGNGATYLIDGETLTPGGTDTVVIGGKTYLVTLFPYATMLEIQLVGPAGLVTSTIFETLFPATATGTTKYNTVSASATQGATPTESVASATGGTTPEAQAESPGSLIAVHITATIIAIASLALAGWP